MGERDAPKSSLPVCAPTLHQCPGCDETRICFYQIELAIAQVDSDEVQMAELRKVWSGAYGLPAAFWLFYVLGCCAILVLSLILVLIASWAGVPNLGVMISCSHCGGVVTSVGMHGSTHAGIGSSKSSSWLAFVTPCGLFDAS